jgi:uncharacterized protein with PIN domain
MPNRQDADEARYEVVAVSGRAVKAAIRKKMIGKQVNVMRPDGCRKSGWQGSPLS